MSKKRILPIILYSIPVIFLLVSYFLLTTSGEDIFQGANTTSDPINDALGIFFVNSRLSDMYAWVVIKFFNYQFEFGVDTIFRLFDLIMSLGIMYLLLYFALGQKPRLNLKDSLIFDFIFIMLFLTPHGRVLYAGFSQIHNYTLIGLIPLLFFLPFIREYEGKNVPNNWYFAILMLFSGVIFGISSNLVPLATLMTLVVLLIYDKILRRKINWHQHLKAWKILGLIGTLIGMYISFFVGPGVNNYAAGGYAESYDYVTFSSLFADPATNIPKILSHEVYNFARVLIPLILVTAALAVFHYFSKKTHASNKIELSRIAIRKLELSVIFMVCYTLTMSQINFPYRLAFPAYLSGILAVIIYANGVLSSIKQKNKIPWTILAIPTCIMSFAILVTHTYLLAEYHLQMKPILESIKSSSETTICISQNSIHTRFYPNGFLIQEDMIADWTLPVKIYDKTITFCEDK